MSACDLLNRARRKTYEARKISPAWWYRTEYYEDAYGMGCKPNHDRFVPGTYITLCVLESANKGDFHTFLRKDKIKFSDLDKIVEAGFHIINYPLFESVPDDPHYVITWRV